MSAPRPVIICDTREQTPLRFSPAVEVIRGTLSSGDYAIAAPDVPEYLTRRRRPTKKDAPPPAFPMLSTSGLSENVATCESGEGTARVVLLPRRVERKSLPDLVACCTVERERFEGELARLAAFRPGRAVIVVEATHAQAEAGIYRSRTAPAAVIASTVAWWEDFGIPTHWGGKPDECARWVERWLVMALERHVEAVRAELAEREAIRAEAAPIGCPKCKAIDCGGNCTGVYLEGRDAGTGDG